VYLPTLMLFIKKQRKSRTGVSPVQNKNLAGVSPVQKSKTTGVSLVHKEPYLQIRKGAYLPHWTREEAAYAVNFRLSDSLPQSILRSWLTEREDIIITAEQRGTPLTPDECRELDYLHSEKVEKYLHNGRGACWLKDDRIARVVADAFMHFDGIRYKLYAWCIMPNHVHIVVRPKQNHSLPTIIHSWKSFTAKRANKILKRKGVFWRVEYYDHLIRDEQDFAHHIAYIWSNPDKAGFRNWKWRWKMGWDDIEKEYSAF